jgi:hypothetical protein
MKVCTMFYPPSALTGRGPAMVDGIDAMACCVMCVDGDHV